MLLAYFNLAATISNFNSQTNPFNITFTGNQTILKYLDMPLYSYLDNLTLRIESFGLNSVNISQIFQWNVTGAGASITVNEENIEYDVNIATQGVIFYTLNNLTLNVNHSLRNYIRLVDSGADTRFILGTRNTTNCTKFSLHPDLNIPDCDNNYLSASLEYNSNAAGIIIHNTTYYIYTNGSRLIIFNATSGIALSQINFRGRYLGLIAGETGGGNSDIEGFIYNISEQLLYITNPKINISTKIKISNYTIYDQNYINLTKPVNITINNSYVNNILGQGCICANCSLTSYICSIPLSFYSDFHGIEEIELYNSTHYTNLTINIYDRETENLITQLTTLAIKGYGNQSTTSGTLNIPQFPVSPDTWTILAESSGYITDQKEITLTDQNSTAVNIYLMNTNSTNLGSLIVQVYDEFYNYITGADVTLLEYNAAQDSFIEVSQCFSDTNGECIFNVEINIKYYIIQASYEQDGRLLKAQSTTTGQLIKLGNTIIELHLETSEEFILGNLYDLSIVPKSTDLIGNISYLTAVFEDTSYRNHTVCIGYYTVSGLNEVLQNSTCKTGSSGIVNYTGGIMLPRQYTWLGKIYILREDGSKNIYKTYRYNAISGTFLSDFGTNTAKAIIFLMLLAALAISWYLKNMALFGYAGIVISLLTVPLHPGLIGSINISFIIILCLSIIYFTNKKQSYS